MKHELAEGQRALERIENLPGGVCAEEIASRASPFTDRIAHVRKP